MNRTLLIALGVSVFAANSVMADSQSVYCPQHSGYINVGMTQQQVIAACGQPISKLPSNAPVTQKVPVTQLIYTSLNTGSVYQGLNSVYYTQWSLPSGTTGINLRVNIINNKIASIDLGGHNENSINTENTNVSSVQISGAATDPSSICSGGSFQVGDDVNKLYTACGSPSMVNNTYINQTIPSSSKPEVWTYQVNQYQSPINLTFVNGKLQSIN